MLVNSIGSIITSLLIPVPHSSSSSSQPTSTLPSPLLTTLLKKHHPSGPSPHQTRQSHVQLISITNTLSRLFIGFIADYFSSSKIPPPPPPATASSSVLNPADTDPEPPQPVRYQLSKVTLLLGVIAFLITPTYLWSAIGLHSIGTLWVLTGGVGTAYGALFTLTPTITAQVFGLKTFGRNFGILSYFVCLISQLSRRLLRSSMADYGSSLFPSSCLRKVRDLLPHLHLHLLLPRRLPRPFSIPTRHRHPRRARQIRRLRREGLLRGDDVDRDGEQHTRWGRALVDRQGVEG
jgi:MFS family permease